jgi:hypothetical protein
MGSMNGADSTILPTCCTISKAANKLDMTALFFDNPFTASILVNSSPNRYRMHTTPEIEVPDEWDGTSIEPLAFVAPSDSTVVTIIELSGSSGAEESVFSSSFRYTSL